MKYFGAAVWAIILSLIAGVIIASIIMDTINITITITGSLIVIMIGIFLKLAEKVEVFSALLSLFKDFTSFLDKNVSSPRSSQNPSQTIEQYLVNKVRAFQDEAENTFVPMTYKTVATTRLRHNLKYNAPLEIFKENRQFMLIGFPGVGKTMVLRELFSTLSKLYIKYNSVPWPLWIPLNDSRNPIDTDELLQFWCNSEKNYNLNTNFETKLHTRPPVIIFDGLNEMPLDTRAKRAAALKEWITKHPMVRVIVSCRIRDYRDDKNLHLGRGIQEVYVEPFESKEIRQFIHNVTHEKYGKKAFANLMRLIDGDDAIFELARIPLHLGMLTQLYLWQLQQPKKDQQNLPNRLKVLYDDYLERRYEHEIKLKRGLHFSWEKLKTKLGKLAYRLISPNREHEGYLSSPEREVVKILGKKALRDAYNLNLLVRASGSSERFLSGSTNVRFFHQSLHGYFALPKLNQALQQKNGRFRFNSLTVSNIASLVRQIGDLGDTAEIAVDTLIPLLDSSILEVKTATKSALIDIGISAIPSLIEELENENYVIRTQIREILIEIGEPTISSLLIYGLKNDSNTATNQISAILIKIFFRDEPRDQYGYISRYESNKSGIRYPGAQYLLQALEKRKYEPSEYRGWVADALGTLTTQQSVRPLLTMLNDDDHMVRADVAWALGTSGNKRVAVDLVNALKRETNETVRLFAAKGLTMLGPEAVQLLIDTFYNASPTVYSNLEASVRILIAQTEYSIDDIIEWNHDPDTIETLIRNVIAYHETRPKIIGL